MLLCHRPFLALKTQAKQMRYLQRVPHVFGRQHPVGGAAARCAAGWTPCICEAKHASQHGQTGPEIGSKRLN